MTDPNRHHVFLSYSYETRDFVEALALRLRADARLSFWFAPWHSIPGLSIRQQRDDALRESDACAIFIGSTEIEGWLKAVMDAAIVKRVEDDDRFRVIPVLVPGVAPPKRRDLPLFLKLFEMVEFQEPDDERAFIRLLSGILGIPPIEVEGFIEVEKGKVQLVPPPTGAFERGHALVIGIANYPHFGPLPEGVLKDARDLRNLLIDPASCSYPSDNVTQLLDDQATADGIRAALADLAARTGPDDTAVVFFSGHGAHGASGEMPVQTAADRSERRTLVQVDRSILRHLLDTRFDAGELRTLCFDLGLDYDDLPGEGKANKARELVAFLERRDRIPELLKKGEQLRPDIAWDQVLVVTRDAPSPQPDADAEGSGREYILPYDCDAADLDGTAIPGAEMTRLLREIPAGRLLVLFDSCHSGGAGDPKRPWTRLKAGLSEDYYQTLAQGKGRVVIASSRPGEVSWLLPGMSNSLFTYYLLEALRGEGRTLEDGYVRVFDVFRHVADHVPTKANQHPVFKATAMEQDFVVALVKRET